MNEIPPGANPQLLDRYIREQALPPEFLATADRHYRPLAKWLAAQRRADAALFVGINGAQGTGKSTLSEVLKIYLEDVHGLATAVLSIDDFYLTRAERKQLATNVHPLLLTRGVPGTHDIALARTTIARLKSLGSGQHIKLPHFDKAADDRAPENEWKLFTGPTRVIILEGWCVAAKAEPAARLSRPVNALEAEEDPDARWRTYVNRQLREVYSPLFLELDLLIFLQAPSFEAIYRWRSEQEAKLRDRLGTTAIETRVMDEAALARFIQHYERITRNNLETLPVQADAVLILDQDHRVKETRYRKSRLDQIT